MSETKIYWEDSVARMAEYRCKHKSNCSEVSICLKANIRLADKSLDWAGKFVSIWGCDVIDLTGLVTMPDVVSVRTVGKLILPPNWASRIKAIDLYKVGIIEIKSNSVCTLDANTAYNHDPKALEYVSITSSLHDMESAPWFDIVNRSDAPDGICFINFKDNNAEALRLDGLWVQGLTVSMCPNLLFVYNTNCHTSAVYLRDLESLYGYTNLRSKKDQLPATGFMSIVNTPNLYRVIDDSGIYNLYLEHPSCWINKLLAKVTHLTLKEPVTLVSRLRKLYYGMRHRKDIKTITLKDKHHVY